jgi:hypothetical protein
MAIDAPPGVQKEDEESPERDEFKAPLGGLVVPGAGRWQREQIAAEPLLTAPAPQYSGGRH